MTREPFFVDAERTIKEAYGFDGEDRGNLLIVDSDQIVAILFPRPRRGWMNRRIRLVMHR